MNRIDRLAGTILLLQGHRGITAERIASHWEISLRTVYRDLAALGEAGVPITCDASGGYRLMKGYHVPPVMFTQEEAAALFVSGTIADQVADASLKAGLQSALLKVRSVLPEDLYERMEAMKRTLAVWLHSGTHADSSECMLPIQNAVLDRRCMEIAYDTAAKGTVTRRRVEPLGVLYYSGHWHLIAYCRLRQDFRDFRMDRVRDWRVLDERFPGHNEFSLHDFVQQQMAGSLGLPLVILVDGPFVDRMRKSLFWTTVKEEPLPDGRVRMRFPVDSEDWVAGWLLGYGGGVTVEEPASLRQSLCELACAVCKKYQP